MAAAVAPNRERPLRVDCVHAAECAGCPLIDAPYAEQLVLKRSRVERAFARFGASTPIGEVTAADRIEEYRSRAKLMVTPDGKIGLFARGGGHRVVDIPNCRVLTPALTGVAATMRALLAEGGAARAIRALDLREVKNPAPRVLVTLVVDRQSAPTLPELQTLAETLRRRDASVAGVAVNYRNADAPQVLGDVTTHLAGSSQATDTHGRSTHVATFGSFVQAHRDQAGLVHDAVLRAVGVAQQKNARVVDLYGGSGAIGLALAAAGADVELVESFPPAVERARDAARSQNVKLRATAADAGRALREYASKKRKFDAVVANPPRRGMSPETRERLAEVGPPVIVYVSCDPDTLARDVAHLALRSYAVERLEPVDMMPLTEEVETVATLRRAAPPAPRVLFRDEQVVAVAKEGHETMRALETRVRRLAFARDAVAVTTLETATSGVVLLALVPAAAEAWKAACASESARISFVAASRGITREKGSVARGKRGPAGVARYRRLAVAGGHSVLRVSADHAIHEGSDTTVRKRLVEIGHPVLGDPRTCDARTNRFFEERNALDRAFLHAARLEIDRPESGERFVVEAPLAGDLRASLERMASAEVIARLEEKGALGPRATVTPAD